MEIVDCQEGVYDCSYSDLDDSITECSAYNNHYIPLQGEVWVVVVASIVMGTMGMAVGGNDVANAWGTSVGSGAIKLQQALVIAALSNLSGSILLGSGVADKLQHGVTAITDPSCFACGFCDSRVTLYSLGMLASLVAAAVFLFMATYKKLPVSTTHAIVGGIVGVSVAANRSPSAADEGGLLRGAQCVDWSLQGFGGMALSWVLSPLLAGAVCCVLYSVTHLYIHRHGFTAANEADAPLKSGAVENTLSLLPWSYSCITWTMVYLIASKSASTKDLSLFARLVLSVSLAVVVFLAARCWLVGRLRKQLSQRKDEAMDRSHNPLVLVGDSSSHFSSGGVEDKCGEWPGKSSTSAPPLQQLEEEDAAVSFCFQDLLLCVATLESFAHGANDTANTTSAFSAVVRVYEDGQDMCSSQLHTPVWVMAVGGSFVAVGVLLFGGGVIETVGHKLSSSLNCHKAFCIEFSSCLSVVLASVLGLPVSTTHCQVGAVIGLGMWTSGTYSGSSSSSSSSSRDAEGVDFSLAGQIVVSWLLTVPFAASVAAGLLCALKLLVR